MGQRDAIAPLPVPKSPNLSIQGSLCGWGYPIANSTSNSVSGLGRARQPLPSVPSDARASPHELLDRNALLNRRCHNRDSSAKDNWRESGRGLENSVTAAPG